MEEIIRWTCRN